MTLCAALTPITMTTDAKAETATKKTVVCTIAYRNCLNHRGRVSRQVAIAAASGWLGSNLAKGFVAHPSYTTRLLAHEVQNELENWHSQCASLPKLTDKDGKDKFAALKEQGATVTLVDYKNADGLVKALEGALIVVTTSDGLFGLLGVDIVVSAIGGNGLVESQVALIDASVKAKVRRFVPSEFGFDPRKTG